MTTASDNLDGLKVFISYPRGGYAHTWAERIESHLKALGVAIAWRDETAIDEGEQDWAGRIEQGVAQADLLICILSADTEGSDWVKRELLSALELGTPILVLRLEPTPLPYLIKEKQPVEHRDNDADTLNRLVAALGREWRKHIQAGPLHRQSGNGSGLSIHSLQRERERKWLGEIVFVRYSDRNDRYVRIEGEQRQSRAIERVMKSERIRTDAILKAFHQTVDDTEQTPREKSYSDVLDAYRELSEHRIKRLAVLGEPGAGKSFSLERIAQEYAEKALRDIAAPIPILVQLGRWTRDSETLEAFISRTLGDLGKLFEDLRDQRRASLLLDGMNEIPPGQRRLKTQQIERLAQDNRFAGIVVSCREKDYQNDFKLPFDTLTLQPLTPSQIREFLHRVFRLQDSESGDAQGEARFWHIAGGDEVREVWGAWKTAGARFEDFWQREEIPRENPNVWDKTSGEQDKIWQSARFDTRSLIRLASNPFMLLIMAVLPQLSNNRAELLAGFLIVLYDREKAAREKRHDALSIPDYASWLARLQELAETLQQAHRSTEEDGAQTALPRAQWPPAIDDGLLDFSRDTSVLQLIGEDLRFTHQLLQEYLASRILVEAFRQDGGNAGRYWPLQAWWERSGWEVVAEIAAESLDDTPDLVPFIAWLARSNPDLAAEVWRKQDRPPLPKKLRAAIHSQWFELMTDIEQLPHPYARAAIGRAMGEFGLDHRKGIGLRPDGRPDIDWREIPAGPFLYQENQTLELPTFFIARYPVTNVQFQAFIDAGGYDDDRWWGDLIKPEPEESTWKQSNHPRTDVDWYESVAFTRWLTVALGYEVRLPTEQEWEKAARGSDGLLYPWGNEYLSGYANIDETWNKAGEWNLRKTSAVGIYPQGRSPYEIMDMAGNVWEWCLNKYEEPDNITPDSSGDGRVLRGGSWINGGRIFLPPESAHHRSTKSPAASEYSIDQRQGPFVLDHLPKPSNHYGLKVYSG